MKVHFKEISQRKSLVKTAIVLAVALLAMHGTAADASIAYGSINNFDTVNDTGHECHGFEIELEDCHSTDITYTYNYNHYGVPKITEDNSVPTHPKCIIRWESKKNPDGSWAAYTAIPAGPIAPTNGHMFTNPAVNFGGEHFGVGYRVQPTAVHYNWLIDNGAGALVHGGAVQVSTPSFTYFPPVAGNPPQVQAVIAPPPPPAPEPKEFGKAVWVKEIRTTSHNNREVKLRDLVSDDPDDPDDKNWKNGEPDEVEVEWQILQKDYNRVGGGANNELAAAAEDLPGGDEVVTRRYEFFKYVGPLDNETGEAMADMVADDGIHGVGSKIINGANVDLSAVVVVGDFTGSQMAAVDVDAGVGLIDHVGEGEVNVSFAPRTVVVEGALPFTCVMDGALPAGMSFDEVTGVVSGTPTLSGEFKFSVTASDGINPDVSKNYTLLIAAADAALPPANLLDTIASPVGCGTTIGDGSYAVDAQATVTATAEPGFAFLNWTDDGTIVSTNATYTLVMDVNHSLQANFVPATTSYTIATSALPVAGGSTGGGGTFGIGTSVTVTAVANAGYGFSNWTENGTVVSSLPSYTFDVTADRVLVANFTAIGNRTITTSSDPVAGGTTSGGGTFAAGASVTVTASPNPNYIFKKWQEGASTVSSSPSYTFVVGDDRALVARFAPIFPVVATASPAHGGTATVTGTFEDGDNVTVLATPAAGFTFVNWTEGGTVVSNTSSYSFKANPARTLIANFSGSVPASYTITTSASPISGGTTSGGGTIAAGSSVTLSANANAGYSFIHWTDGAGTEVSTSPVYAFTPVTSGGFTAHFAPPPAGVHFDFDISTPALALNQSVPMDQTTAGLTATFTSPAANGFHVQTEAAMGRTLTKFNGFCLESAIDGAALSIRFDQAVSGISLDFATLEPLGAAATSDLQITAIDHSSGAPVIIGMALAHGTQAAGDSLPVGTVTLNAAVGTFDEVIVQLPALPDGAQRFLVDNILVSPTAGLGGTMLLANPNWNITLTDFGFSDFLLDNTPGFEGREYLSGEWASAIAYKRNGSTRSPTWLEPNFLFPDWRTNSDFNVVSGIHLVGSNLDGLPIAESVIANNDLEITLRFEMVDTVVGTPMGIKPASATDGDGSINSNRYVMNQTFIVKNISGTTLASVQLFQLLHGFISQRGQYDDRGYAGRLSEYRYDTTMSGIDASSAGQQSSTVGLEDLIGFQAKIAPSALEIGHYGIEGNGVDDHVIGKPSDGVHLSVEDNWTNAPYDSRQGRDGFAPAARWIAGAQRWELGSINPGQSVHFDIVLSLLTGTKVTIDSGSGGTGGHGSCNGGSTHVGGVDFEFEDIEQEGTFFGEYSEAEDDELAEREDYGEFALPAFETPNGSVHQMWKLSYSGTHLGNIHLTFAYNPALLPAGYDENQLAIYHFGNGAWEKLPGTVDTARHVIHVVTPNLSPFMLGVNDVVVTPKVELSVAAPGELLVSWPESFRGWILQENTDLSLIGWVTSNRPVTVVEGISRVAVPMSAGSRFFRLVKP